MTIITFAPVLRNGFVAWDDPQTFMENPDLNPPTIARTLRFWNPVNPIAGLYVPITYTVWAAISSVARDGAGTWHAWPFHLASVLAHCASAVLAFAIFRQLLDRDWPAFAGAMLFALHPLQVESVAWASGLKDVLAGCLALAALRLHLRSRHIASTILFTLAMLAKPSAASVLLIALSIDLLIVRKPIVEIARSLGAWLIMAVPLLVIARIAQTTELVQPVAIPRRALVAMDAVAFYLGKLFAPLNLATDYGRTPAHVFSTGIGSALLVLALAVIAIAVSRSRVVIASALILLGGLVFNLGLVPFQFQLYSTVADHYIYLAMLGPALAAAYAVGRLPLRISLPIAAIAIATLGVLSVRQTLIWRDSVTLFTHSVMVNPHSAGLHNNLGRALGERSDLDGAAEHFRAALAIQSGTALARRNLALVEFRRGNIDAAIEQLKQSIEMMERDYQDVSADRRDLVRWLAERERWPEVVEQLERAQIRDPMNADIARLLETARRRATTAPTQP